MPPYWNALAKDSFGNWRTLMEDMTLSPAMGLYLNMIQSNKPAAGQIANENFGREMLQLFSTGLVLLNQDGTPQLDGSGNPMPVYTEAQVEAFARAYTGWTYAGAGGAAPAKFPNYTANYDSPMAPVEANHDTTTKTLLNGTVLSAGGSARADLKGALDNIFEHPNLPPFVSKQLIQHLVTSTPTPAYVARVAAVFTDNGKGVRGDMQAVLRAILTDSEARAGDTNAVFDGGHLREPMLYLTSVLRGLGYASTNADATNLYAYAALSGYTAPLGEQPFRSPSVFNFLPAGVCHSRHCAECAGVCAGEHGEREPAADAGEQFEHGQDQRVCDGHVCDEPAGCAGEDAGRPGGCAGRDVSAWADAGGDANADCEHGDGD